MYPGSDDYWENPGKVREKKNSEKEAFKKYRASPLNIKFFKIEV